MAECAFCREDVAQLIRKSHIVPEWMFKDCYSERHEALAITGGGKHARKRQKGLWAEFLCPRCEAEFGEHDRYASNALTDSSPGFQAKHSIQATKQTADDIKFRHWSGLDFRRIQKFVFSVIIRDWLCDERAGLPIEDRCLSRKYFDLLTSIYRGGGVVDDSTIPILMFHPTTTSMTVLPANGRKKGHQSVIFLGLGFMFEILASNHKKPDEEMICRLKADGTAISLELENHEIGLVKSVSKSLRAHRPISPEKLARLFPKRTKQGP